jgi:ribosomal protein L29
MASLAAMNREQLKAKEVELREALARLGMKRHARRLDKSSELGATKRELARVLTTIRAKELGVASGDE